MKAALLQAVDEVERCAFEEQLAFFIDDNVLAVEFIAAVLGLVFVGLVRLAESLLTRGRYRPLEGAA